MEIKGIKYIGPVLDNCYDEKTEVLTDEGWKFFKDLTKREHILTLNKEHVLEYQPINDYIEKEYSGDMYRFRSKKAAIDLLVTPNHNMYTQTESGRRYGGKDKWRFEPAVSVYGCHRFFKKDADNNIEGPKTFSICGRGILTEDWLEFLGYYLSEGSSTITKEKHYIIQLRQFGQDLFKMATALTKVTKNKINIKEKDGRVIVNDKELCLYLKKNFGNKYEKNIPRQVLNSCSKKQLLVLFNALMLGDGHDISQNYKEGKISGGSSYNTSSIRLRDDFMELLLKIGYSGSYIKVYSKGDTVRVYDRVYKAKEDNWTIRIRFSNNVCAKNKNNNFFEDIIKYSGKIYCVNVDNHTLYVRRNGCPVWSGNSGYAKAARENILALHKLGIPVTVKPISFESARPNLGASAEVFKSLISSSIPYNIVIMHCTPEFWSKHQEKGKTMVGYTIWETTKLHPDWVTYINNNCDLCLVGCEWNVAVFKQSGITKPLYSVPHCISMDGYKGAEPYNISGVANDAYVFYSILQWQERKNPLATIKAYWSEFGEKDNVALVLKTYRSDYSDQEKDAVRNTIKRLKSVCPAESYAPIYLILDMLSEDEIIGLHARGDCYVSLDRGEGFGLSGFAAGAAGNPIIVTGFGGVTEYAKKDNSYCVEYVETPVFGMPWTPWYRLEQYWAEPNIKHGAQCMRYVYENRGEAKAKGLKLQSYIKENFTQEIIGNKIINAIKSI